MTDEKKKSAAEIKSEKAAEVRKAEAKEAKAEAKVIRDALPKRSYRGVTMTKQEMVDGRVHSDVVEDLFSN